MEVVTLESLRVAIERAPIARGMPAKIAAIDGHGGAGKSTLAESLGRLLNAEVLHTDDFTSLDVPTDWWPRLIAQALEPIKNGAQSLSYERGRWGPDHHPEAVIDQPVTPIMLLEGVSAARREFRPYLSYAIWIETPVELCLQRGLQRDGQETLTQWRQWLADEDAYIERDAPRVYADLVVLGTDPLEQR